jgi:murein DD-endopeptidase MepM/ murein hydrolase activator NlpD
VHRGQVLGMVGTSGNSSEPHLHFQVTDGPSTLLVGRAALPAAEISRHTCRRVHQGFRPGDHRRQTDRDRAIGRTGRPRTRIAAGPVDRRPAGLRVRVTIL